MAYTTPGDSLGLLGVPVLPVVMAPFALNARLMLPMGEWHGRKAALSWQDYQVSDLSGGGNGHIAWNSTAVQGHRDPAVVAFFPKDAEQNGCDLISIKVLFVLLGRVPIFSFVGIVFAQP